MFVNILSELFDKLEVVVILIYYLCYVIFVFSWNDIDLIFGLFVYVILIVLIVGVYICFCCGVGVMLGDGLVCIFWL